MKLETKRLLIMDATPGELGLAAFFVEKEKLLIPACAHALGAFTFHDKEGPVGLIQFYGGHAPPGVVGFSMIIFDADKRGDHLGEEALEAILREAEFPRLEACPAADNVAARKGMEKLGFHFEGILRNWYPRGDKMVDAAMYSKVGN